MVETGTAMANKVRDSYERIAESYNRVRHRPWEECLEFMKGFRPRSVVLDLGCGTGRHLLATIIEGHSAVGLDFSKAMLKATKEKLSKIPKRSDISDVIVADGANLPFKENAFDYVLFIATLHNMLADKQRIASLNEVGRVLMINGRTLITVWRRFQPRFIKSILKCHLKRLLGYEEDFIATVPWKTNDHTVPRYYYLFSANELKNEIRQSNLKILKFLKVKIGSKWLSDNYFVTACKKSVVS